MSDFSYTENEGYYTLMVEWDGNRPPTRWYNRLAALGLSIRSDKKSDEDESPLSRRYHPGSAGVTHQEGAIILQKESAARALGYLARSMGAKAVTVGYTVPIELKMTNDDAAVMNRIKTTLERRGRPPEKQDWVISCRDCGRTSPYNGARPSHCPHCNSFLFWQRTGIQVVLKDYRGLNLFDNWITSRFVTGGWEKPIINRDNPDAIDCPAKDAKEIDISDPKASEHAKSIKKTRLYQQVHEAYYNRQTINREQAMALLDAGFLVLFRDEEKRKNNRIRSITNYIQNDGNMDGVQLINDSTIDSFDVYSIVGSLAFSLPRIK